MSRRLTSLLFFSLICLSASACGGSGGTTAPPLPDATFTGSGATAAADSVRLTGTTNGNLVTVSVMIGGPTTNNDIFSFAFDLLLTNPTMVELISSQEGNALTPGTNGVVALANQNGSVITVGVAKLGANETGNGIGSGEATVVNLTLRVNAPGTCGIRLGGTSPGQPAAFDSNANSIGSISFDGSSATITGN